MIQEELPYAGTSGWSGTDTSRERAEFMDRSGRTQQMTMDALTSIALAGTIGVTWKDLSEVHGWHHGQASGRLTTLHKAGRIVRLKEKRKGCRVYVMPRFQNGRESDEPAVRMTQTEMFETLNYLHSRLILSWDHGGVKFIEQKLDAYWPDWKEKP